MKRAKTLFVFLLFFLCFDLWAETQFNFTPGCIESQKLISQLRLKSAATLLKKEHELHPENCAVDYLENYVDFYNCITSQDIGLLHTLEKNKSKRLHRFASLPDNNPYKLYAQAEAELQWAFSRVFHQEYVTAAIEFRNCYKALEQNNEKFPLFASNNKDIGVLSAMLGSIPENFRWILNVVGMKGEFRSGLNMLHNFIEHQSYAPDLLLDQQNAAYYYIFLQMNFGDKQQSWTYCEKFTRDYRSNLLSTYLRAFVSIKTGHNDYAIECLSNRPDGPEYANFPILDYLYGVALMNKLNDNASIQFKKFITFSSGQNLVKDAYKRLSWIGLIQGDIDKFLVYQNMTIKYGIAVTEEDKAALKDATNKIKPNILLLKARLLCDGGYYDKAFNEVLKVQPTNKSEKLEMEYRTGRILYELKQYQKAQEHFMNCIRLNDPNLHLHFAPSSCNYMATIYELLGNRLKAIEYYRQTLAYKNYEYKNGATIKAKQGLERLNAD